MVNDYVKSVQEQRSNSQALLKVNEGYVTHEVLARILKNWQEIPDRDIERAKYDLGLDRCDKNLAETYREELEAENLSINEEVEELIIESCVIANLASQFSGFYISFLPESKKELRRMLERKAAELNKAAVALKEVLTKNTNNRGNSNNFEPIITQDFIEFCVAKEKEKRNSHFPVHMYRNIDNMLSWIAASINKDSTETYIEECFKDKVQLRRRNSLNMENAFNAFVESFSLCLNTRPNIDKNFRKYAHCFEQVYFEACPGEDDYDSEDKFYNLLGKYA